MNALWAIAPEKDLRANSRRLKANDKQEQAGKIVILGLDPGIQGVFNLNTKGIKNIPCIEIPCGLAEGVFNFDS